MPRIYATPSADAVVALLRETGEQMTAAEIADALHKNRITINSAIRTARERKWIHIQGYRRNYGTQGTPSPLDGLGDFKDAKPLKNDRHADRRRYAEKMKEVNRLRWQKRRGRVQDHWLQQLAGKSMKPGKSV